MILGDKLLLARASIRTSWRENRGFGFCAQIIGAALNFHMISAYPCDFRRMCQGLIGIGFNAAHFHKAKSFFLCGRFKECLEEIDAALVGRGSIPPDVAYLKADALVGLGYEDKAWLELENLAKRSNRQKTWQKLAELVTQNMNYDRFVSLCDMNSSAEHRGLKSKPNLENRSLAALRGGHSEVAIELWREEILSHPKKTIKGKVKRHLNKKLMSIALSDIRNYLKNQDIDVFLVSGTFLGCIRDGDFISGDKDIDLGVFETVQTCGLINILRRSCFLVVHQQRSPDTIRVTHVNGTPIDIFIHREEGKTYWHAGCKARWWNTKFSLAEYRFCGSVFLGPADHDLYLQENYGDWMKRVPDFDHIFDTPNSVINNQGEVVVHCLRGIYFRGHSLGSHKRLRGEDKNLALQVALMGRDTRKIGGMGDDLLHENRTTLDRQASAPMRQNGDI